MRYIIENSLRWGETNAVGGIENWERDETSRLRGKASEGTSKNGRGRNVGTSQKRARISDLLVGETERVGKG